jgi:hypothetical protein
MITRGVTNCGELRGSDPAQLVAETAIARGRARPPERAAAVARSTLRERWVIQWLISRGDGSLLSCGRGPGWNDLSVRR